MATFPDLSTVDHFLSETSPEGSEAATLSLPIRGRTYTWHKGGLTLWAMLKIQRLNQQILDAARRSAEGDESAAAEIALTNAEQDRMDRDLMGEDVIEQMAEDGVTWAQANHVSTTLLTWHMRGRDAALAVWTMAGRETKTDPPARAASTKTAGSSTTTRRPAKPRSGGRKSSGTGGSSKRTSPASTTST